MEGSVEEGLGHLSVPAGALPAMFEPLRADRLVAGLLAAAAPQLPLPWLFAAPPGLARGVAGPDVPQAVADALVLAAPHLAAWLPERPRGQSRSGADVVAAAGLSLAGVGPSFVTALAPRRGGSPGVLWLGGPPGLAVEPPDAAALLRIEELCAVVGAVAERTYRQGLLRWARRLLRPGGLLPRLAAEAPLARLLDTLCLSFEGLYPARWAIVPWVGDEAGLVYGPSLTAAERTALEGSARRLLLDGGHKRTAAGSPHRTLYRELAAVLESLGGHTAYPHTARNARGEIVASLLVLDAPREQLRQRDRIVLRTAANFAVLCLERQRLRRLHAASDARYRSLLDATSHLVWFLDAAGTIRHARGWHALTGHHVPETMEAWLCAVHPDDRAAMRLAHGALCQPGSDAGSRVVECRVGGADGRYHHLRFHLLARRTASGDLNEILAAAWDVTHEREAERALKGLVQERERYASVLAHELRTPLATMAAALDVLRPTVPADPLAQEALSVLSQSLANQSRLVTNVLDSAHLAGSGTELAMRPLDLCALLDSLIPSLSLQARQKGLALSVCQPSEGLWLNADRDRLVQLIGNLVTNAVRYTPAGGNVWLALERDGDRLCLTVADDGVGIATGDLPRIFDPYVRGRERRAGEAGLGLGLHLVREVARAHSGEVEAASVGPGHGSTFRVYLPVQSGLASQRLLAAPIEAAPPAAGRPTRQVLLVEDDYGLREMLVALLAREGFTARTARSGAEALRRAVTGPPVCAAICDLGLPDISGLDLLPRLRALPGCERLPALALTGWGEHRDLLRTRAAGFDRHLVKPADMGALVAWLRSVAPAGDGEDVHRPAGLRATRQGTGGS